MRRLKPDPIYWGALRCAVEQGLAEADAVRLVPAEDLLGQSDEHAETARDIEAGLAASIAGLVTDNADVRSEFGLDCGAAAKASKIKSEAEYRQALREVETLLAAEPGGPEGARLDLLADQVVVHEVEYFPLDEAATCRNRC